MSAKESKRIQSPVTKLPADSKALTEGDMESCLSRIAVSLERLVDLLELGGVPTLWDLEKVAEWMGVNSTTAKLYVMSRPDFPEPFRPTGKEAGQKRWFRDEIVAFARGSRAHEGGEEPVPQGGKKPKGAQRESARKPKS